MLSIKQALQKKSYTEEELLRNVTPKCPSPCAAPSCDIDCLNDKIAYEQETIDMCKEIREFSTGATRDTEQNKLDFEGFLSPLVIERYAKYMNAHRKQANGQMRDSDNWQKGIPIVVYMKSMFRHFFDLWKLHRGYGPVKDSKDGHDVLVDEALCATIFNASGYLHEVLKNSRGEF